MTRKLTRTVFVIMPFVNVEGGARDEDRLTAFFENHLKRPIESADHLEHRYVVSRSGEAFNITREIIRALCRADIVIADLSGTRPNPNVMYELGVRLAVSDKPVILIKEELPGSPNPFDVFAYYTKPYDPLDYLPLEQHLVAKLSRFETGEEVFDNEIRRLINEELGLLTPDLRTISPDKQRELVLRGMRLVADIARSGFGPHGLGLRMRSGSDGGALVTKGSALGDHVSSENPFEQEGIHLLADVAKEIAGDLGDGSKLVMLMAQGMVDAAIAQGHSRGPAESAEEVRAAAANAIELLQASAAAYAALPVNDVAATAAKVVTFPIDMERVFRSAAPNGVITLEEWEGDETNWGVAEGYRLDRGAQHEDFLSEENGTRATLTNAFVLLCPENISSMKDLLPVLEAVARSGRPMLLVAGRVEGEALATLRLNADRGIVRCVPIPAPGVGDRRSDMLQDLAVLTGGQVITLARGLRLENTVLGDLGTAERVVIGKHFTEITGGGGAKEAIEAQIGRLSAMKADAGSEYEREKILERIALLAGKHVTIRVGGQGADARRAARRVISEGLAACHAAIASGVIEGVCSQLSRLASVLEEPTGALATGYGRRVVAEGLRAPLSALAGNADESLEPILDAVRDGGVYDARRHVVEQAGKNHLVDPLLISVRAIGLAAALTSDFLRTGAWTPRKADDQ